MYVQHLKFLCTVADNKNRGGCTCKMLLPFMDMDTKPSYTKKCKGKKRWNNKGILLHKKRRV